MTMCNMKGVTPTDKPTETHDSAALSCLTSFSSLFKIYGLSIVWFSLITNHDSKMMDE